MKWEECYWWAEIARYWPAQLTRYLVRSGRVSRERAQLMALTAHVADRHWRGL